MLSGAFDHDGVYVADEPPDDDELRRIMVRAGRRVMSKLHRFFDHDDDRLCEVDRLVVSLDAASATPQPTLFPRDGRRGTCQRLWESSCWHSVNRIL